MLLEEMIGSKMNSSSSNNNIQSSSTNCDKKRSSCRSSDKKNSSSANCSTSSFNITDAPGISRVHGTSRNSNAT